jgi:hypothetical protein
MDLQNARSQLKAQGQMVVALATGLTHEEARWKPNPVGWSILEVVNHLVDEEIYDFRAHLDHILHTPEQPWPKIDPQGWVTQRHYDQQNLDDTLLRFEAEREKSLSWLAGLPAPDWDAAVTQSWGTLSAGDMLAAWLAHDLLHLRQLVDLRYKITKAANQPYQLDYAGKW